MAIRSTRGPKRAVRSTQGGGGVTLKYKPYVYILRICLVKVALSSLDVLYLQKRRSMKVIAVIRPNQC